MDVPLVSTAFFQGLVQNAFHSIRLQHHWNTVTPKLITISFLTPSMLSVPGIAKLPELAWMLFSVFRMQLLQESQGATEVMAKARLELKQFFESMPQRSMPVNDPILLRRSLKAILKYSRNDAEKQAWITLLLFELCQDSTLMLSDLRVSVLKSLDHSRLFLLSYFRYVHRLESSLFLKPL